MLISWSWHLFQALHTGSRKANLTLTSKKVQLVWGKRQQKAFKLQLCLTEAPVLAQPDPAKQCVMHTAMAAVNAALEANRLSQVQAMRC